MGKLKSNNRTEFESILLLINEARTRAFAKVNAELVLLYFNIGKIVSEKVENKVWGEGTVDELANYIAMKQPVLTGFNRRGLYRMKQFYESYSVSQFVSPLATLLETALKVDSQISIVSAVPTQLRTGKKSKKLNVSAVPTHLKNKNVKGQKVSALPTQLQNVTFLNEQFVSMLLTQVSWANHLEILSGTKLPEERLFYLMHNVKEKWSMRELRRQLSSGYFERTMLSNKKLSGVQKHLPDLETHNCTSLYFSEIITNTFCNYQIKIYV